MNTKIKANNKTDAVADEMKLAATTSHSASRLGKPYSHDSASPPEADCVIDEKEILRRIPVCRKTLWNKCRSK